MEGGKEREEREEGRGREIRRGKTGRERDRVGERES